MSKCKDCKWRGNYCIAEKEDDTCGLYKRKWRILVRDFVWWQKYER